MHVVIVEFTVRPDKAEAFRARVLQQARDSLEREPNCHVFDVCLDPEASGRFILYEVYGSAEDFTAHLQTDHFKAFDAEVRDWIEGKSVRRMQRLAPGDLSP